MLHIIMTHKPILHIKCLINEKSRKNDQTWRTMKPQIIKSACLVTKTFENYSFIYIYLLKIVQPNFLKKSLFAKKKKKFPFIVSYYRSTVSEFLSPVLYIMYTAIPHISTCVLNNCIYSVISMEILLLILLKNNSTGQELNCPFSY